MKVITLIINLRKEVIVIEAAVAAHWGIWQGNPHRREETWKRSPRGDGRDQSHPSSLLMLKGANRLHAA